MIVIPFGTFKQLRWDGTSTRWGPSLVQFGMGWTNDGMMYSPGLERLYCGDMALCRSHSRDLDAEVHFFNLVGRRAPLNRLLNWGQAVAGNGNRSQMGVTFLVPRIQLLGTGPLVSVQEEIEVVDTVDSQPVELLLITRLCIRFRSNLA